MILTIDGKLYVKLLYGGLANLESNKDYINSLNVFPVPDGDTGTNMFLTFTSAVKSIEGKDTLKDISDSLQLGALQGARGNSGVILSQILKGLSSVIETSKQLNAKTFARALKIGSEVAYSVVTKPKEGTILTVIRLLSDFAVKIASNNMGIEEFFDKILVRGEEVLNQTPDMLPILKSAGVVDAGGMGLLVILKGMQNVLMGKEPEIPKFTQPIAPLDTDEDEHELDNIKFAYCTEFFVKELQAKVTTADIDKLRDRLEEIGDCVLVIGGLNLVKVHVHTNNPDRALANALMLGELDGVKVENMLEQKRKLDIEKAKLQKKPLGVISVCAGEGVKNLFKELGVDYIVEGGQTMNPSVHDIADAVKKVNAENIIILPNNKNVVLACEQVSDLTDKKIFVVPTRNVSEGITASMQLSLERSAEDNVKNMKRAVKNLKTGSVTKAVRDAEMDGFNLHDGDFIGIDSEILSQADSAEKALVKLTEVLYKEEGADIITLIYGSDTLEKDAKEVIKKLEGMYPATDFALYFGGQPNYYYYISLE